MIYNRNGKKRHESEVLKNIAVVSDEEMKLVHGDHNGDYGEKITALVRERYSLSEELAILRQRDSKPSEFAEYNAYVEGCKAKVKSGTI